MERFESAVNLGLYTPISEKWTLHIPGSNGGALFGTTSAEPIDRHGVRRRTKQSGFDSALQAG